MDHTEDYVPPERIRQRAEKDNSFPHKRNQEKEQKIRYSIRGNNKPLLSSPV